MSASRMTSQEFIQSVFSPVISVLSSSDADELCRKNNLSFVELLKPFSEKIEVTLRDPSQVQASVTSRVNFDFRDLNFPYPPPAQLKKLLNEAVSRYQPSTGADDPTIISTRFCVGSYNLLVYNNLPWFDSYRDAFFRTLPPQEHDFTRHFLGCIFVVSSAHAAPQEELVKLIHQQQKIQQNSAHQARWFAPNVVRYYVLLHDAVSGNSSKAEATYLSMKNIYGTANCFMLTINSIAPMQTSVAEMSPETMDVWQRYIFDMGSSSEARSPTSPASRNSATPNGPQSNATSATSINDSGRNGSSMHHPLINCSPTPDSLLNARCSIGDADINDVSLGGNSMGNGNDFMRRNEPYGMCLSPQDRDKIRVFIQTFATQCLVPFLELQIRTLHDQVSNKKGIHRSFVNATRTLFTRNRNQSTVDSSVNSVIYSQDASELQVRKLGDLSFLFHLYESAYQAYHSAKRDFSSDQAWLYSAGAEEMAALSVFMLGRNSNRQYPAHYMDSAINKYLTNCKLPHLATRATLLNAECLRNLGLYSQMSTQLIKMTSEDSDLRSALLLEQASYCFLATQLPCVRKYAFHLVLAGHRYSKAGHRKHSLRAYTEAQQVYNNRRWSLAEDHINFIIGRQSVYLKMTDNAFNAFHSLLNKPSEQNETQQAIFLREYLSVLRDYQNTSESPYGPRDLPIPTIDVSATRVTLSVLDASSRDTSADDLDLWNRLEERCFNAALKRRHGPSILTGVMAPTFRPTLTLLTDTTDNSVKPLAVVNEPIIVALSIGNPLKVALAMSNVRLLWTFEPVDSSPVSNVVKQRLLIGDEETEVEADSVVTTEVSREVLLEPQQHVTLKLALTPRAIGQLHLEGVAYHIALSPNWVIQQPDVSPILSSSGDASTPAMITMPVLGRQMFDLKGPKIKNPKDVRDGQWYGKDYRLHPTIVPAMPLLKVDFPIPSTTMLCGEVQRTVLRMTNVGSEVLTNLQLATPTPDMFSLDTKVKPESPSTHHHHMPYRESPLKAGSNVRATAVVSTKSSLDYVMEVPEAQRIAPGAQVELPVWLRGPDAPGEHTLRLLFYYETDSNSGGKHQVDATTNEKRMKRRVLRYSVELTSLAGVILNASAQPSLHCSQTAADELDRPNNSVLLAIHAKNASEATGVRSVDVSLVQVACVSDAWCVQPVNTDSQYEPSLINTVKPTETRHFVFKATPYDDTHYTGSDSQSCILSQLPLAKVQIDSTCPPCVDFCWRSRLVGNLEPLIASAAGFPTELAPFQPGALVVPKEKQRDPLDLTLALLWKAAVERNDGMQIVMGQHHVNIRHFHVNYLSVPSVPTLSMNKQKALFCGAPSMIGGAPPLISGSPQRLLLSSGGGATVGVNNANNGRHSQSLLWCTLLHSHTAYHDFHNQKLLLQSVSLVIHNPTFRDLFVLVEPCERRISPLPGPVSSGLQPQDGGSVPLINVATMPASLVSSPSNSDQLAVVGEMGGFTWAQSVRRRSLRVGARATITQPLVAVFARPGTFNLSASLKLSVRTFCINDDGSGDCDVDGTAAATEASLNPSLIVVHQQTV